MEPESGSFLLCEQCEALKKKYNDVRQDYAAVKAVNAYLKDQMAELRAENDALKSNQRVPALETKLIALRFVNAGLMQQLRALKAGNEKIDESAELAALRESVANLQEVNLRLLERLKGFIVAQ